MKKPKEEKIMGKRGFDFSPSKQTREYGENKFKYTTQNSH